MTKSVPENKARQGRWGWHGLRILVAGLLLAFIAWGAVEIYGELIKPPTTQQTLPEAPPAGQKSTQGS
ncbi:hypothetical protein EN828_01730 [Mesorhizobium sp. M2D.F.Ca.ET.185.01.1.1]|uniref:hypothetical protein n=1 Tax=unclassified Mesorhizobium TaxID=325217 RepID=UPI000FCC8658|nr:MULTISPECIES: hypothetical protein [unclassified Mesorhizobium]TGP53806.1 hypothetical protein EN873_11495 [bacterium M00.F.Ca.ET.230.01.1.1]TGP83342.1 hypothetical protein EN870_02030 [bacterium M00.F.Ca.ET.227.01.1.1]TGP99297.1 hypothetical protein EN864_05930 [bacterium M00.F.Ca.ET.221.01.1.1]TGQ00027.1 hypothetical protein EN865_05930 [bacterium M00.F.Ca.ET.222.01.1.1]TGU11413.1 hypothetical protein EN806_22430 [bacterium M00.F.Ca.ET.163.01.1.1]TGU35011.1 hypothetical protein EN799_187